MSTCHGYDACSKALKTILEDSKTKLKNATQENLAQVVLEISEALVDFTSNSEPKDYSDWDEIEQIEKIDSLADYTRQFITAESIEGSVKVIMDSTSQLNQLAKKLKSETAKKKTNERQRKYGSSLS